MDELEHFEFKHPTLGQLTGRRRQQNVVQFRGIPYGRVPARFRQAQLVTEISSNERTCTEYGYACPQLRQSMAAFGGPLPGEQKRRYDEFSCLNLTITAPFSNLDGSSQTKVPVIVYVHGGGLAEGAHYGAVHDCTRMVDLSCKEMMPVIVVSIHYRLNFFGLLACQDLVNDATKHNELPCNFALYDQRLAFRWVKTYIDGFGGDSTQITAFGESAGSASLSFHMCSTAPLFKRVILQSGNPSTIPPMTLTEKEASYLSLLRFCEINEDDPQRLDKLRAVPADKLLDAIVALKMFAFSPLAHESFFPILPTYSNQCEIFAKCDWVESIIVGDCVYEGYLFCEQLKNIKSARFAQLVRQTIGDGPTTKLLDTYQMSPNMDQNLFWTRLNTYVGDVMFSLPAHKIARALARTNKRVYRYTLSLRNPFHGSIFGNVLGHHFVDLLYQFMTLLERYPEERQKRASIQFARYWLEFGNGKAPWPEFKVDSMMYGAKDDQDHIDGEEIIAVADSREGWVIRSRRNDEELSQLAEGGPRRYRQWEVLEEIFDSRGDQAQKIIDTISFPHLMSIAEG